MREDLEREIIRIAQKIIDTQNEFNLPQLKSDLGKMYEKVSILSFVEKYYKSLGASENRICYTSNKVASFIEEQQKEYSIFDIPVEVTIVEPMKLGQVAPQPQVETNSLYADIRNASAPVSVPPPIGHSTPYQGQPTYELYRQTPLNASSSVSQQSVQPFINQSKVQPEATIFGATQTVSHQSVNQPFISQTQAELPSSRFVQPLQSIEKEPQWVQYSTPVAETNQINNPYISQSQQLVFDRKEEPEPKPAPSINDHFGKTVQIGLNDRLAFIRQLFFGSESEYNKVIQNINNLHSVQDIALYIEQDVKPIYNYWKGKDEYEERFLSLILKRFEM